MTVTADELKDAVNSLDECILASGQSSEFDDRNRDLRADDALRPFPSFPVPACGGSFTPYGAAELSFAHGMVAAEVLRALTGQVSSSRETIWVGRSSNWGEQGGAVTSSWLEAMGDPGSGGFLTSRPWPRSETCPVCGQFAATAA